MRVLLLVTILSLLPGSSATGAEFLSVLEDVPLMPGLTEVPDSELVFDSPGGRIVEVTTAGRPESGSVAGFYAATLPQLGWTPAGPGRFRREAEVLNVTVNPGTGGKVTVHFALGPNVQ